jgi:tetratricopeptide (TPR) repeat protein
MRWRVVSFGIFVSLFLACTGVAQNSGSLITPGSNGTVTTNQLQAPRKAREALAQAQQAMRASKFAEAEKQLARALAAYPNYSIALTARGILSLLAQRVKDAAADLSRAIEVDPSYGPPYVVLASLANNDSQYDEALPLAEKGLQLAPEAWQSHVEVARALHGKGSDDGRALREAIVAEQLALADASPQIRAYLHYLKGSLLINNPAAARFEFEKAVKEEPDGPYATGAKRAIQQLEAIEKQG